jgi:hypothetical protein
MQDGSQDPSRTIETFGNEGDYTHTAIYVCLELFHTFSGHARQNPSVNSKMKPDPEEEEKEKEEEEEEEEEQEEEEEKEEKKKEEEEEETATSLDGNEVSHENVDVDTCDHSK